MGEHPTPWRIGRKLADSYLGPVTLYDGEAEGDGNQPGRFIGVMFSSELAIRVVEAVNTRQRAERLEGLLPKLVADVKQHDECCFSHCAFDYELLDKAALAADQSAEAEIEGGQ